MSNSTFVIKKMSKLTTKDIKVSEELGKLCMFETIEGIEAFIKENKNQIDINVAFIHRTPLFSACTRENVNLVKLIIDNFKEQIDINSTKDHRCTILHTICYLQNNDIIKLLIDNFKDSIDIMILDENDRPSWYAYLYHYQAEDDFKDLFLSMLLNRDKSKDPYGLTPLHIAYLLRNKEYRRIKIKVVNKFYNIY